MPKSSTCLAAEPHQEVGHLDVGARTPPVHNDVAHVTDKNGKNISDFHRNNGGLYIAKMVIKQPETPFGRPS